MNMRPLTICILATAPLLLSGCTVMRKLGFAPSHRSTQPAVAEAGRYGPTFTSIGRMHLDHGNFGLAIESFQAAIGRNEPSGPALNGMGVAYARIGRADLAAQFFRLAMDADPANPSYSDNLALLTRTQGFMEAQTRQAMAAAPAAPAPAPAAPAPAQAAAASEEQPGRLTQVGRREFAIKTLRTLPAAGHGEALAGGFRPVVRISLRAPEPARSTSPAKTPAVR